MAVMIIKPLNEGGITSVLFVCYFPFLLSLSNMIVDNNAEC